MNYVVYIREHMNKMKLIQETLLDYLEIDDSENSQLQKLIKIFDDQQIRKHKHKLKSVLHLISRISNNHHKSSDFFNKIEELLKIIQDDIKKMFSNFNIFNIFKGNKKILLFLLDQKIIRPDNSISIVLTKGKYKKRNYPEYFYPEFKLYYESSLFYSKISSMNSNIFTQKRLKGENDSEICQLIQNDSIDDFISFTSQNNLSLSSTIEPSLFETNSFLLKNKPTLIEYSAFCGSIRILKYINENNIELTPSIWLYAIHSQSFELINFLEENQVKWPNDDINECFNESIKCHHINFMNYFKSKETNISCLFLQSLKYYNFVDLCDNEKVIDENNISLLFYHFCKCDYLEIVRFLLQNSNEININSKVVLFFDLNRILKIVILVNSV